MGLHKIEYVTTEAVQNFLWEEALHKHPVVGLDSDPPVLIAACKYVLELSLGGPDCAQLAGAAV